MLTNNYLCLDIVVVIGFLKIVGLELPYESTIDWRSSIAVSCIQSIIRDFLVVDTQRHRHGFSVAQTSYSYPKSQVRACNSCLSVHEMGHSVRHQDEKQGL
jgi:hypothetical protein